MMLSPPLAARLFLCKVDALCKILGPLPRKTQRWDLLQTVFETRESLFVRFEKRLQYPGGNGSEAIVFNVLL
jgi:hypothetical protein